MSKFPFLGRRPTQPPPEAVLALIGETPLLQVISFEVTLQAVDLPVSPGHNRENKNLCKIARSYNNIMKYNESLSRQGPRCDHTSTLKTYEPTVYHQTTRSTSAARAVPLGSWDSARYPPRSTARKMPSPASAAAGARCLGCFCDLQRTDQKCSKYLQILSSMIQMVQIQNGPSICMRQTLEHGWTRPDTLCWSLECRKPSSATRRSGAILEASDFS